MGATFGKDEFRMTECLISEVPRRLIFEKIPPHFYVSFFSYRGRLGLRIYPSFSPGHPAC